MLLSNAANGQDLKLEIKFLPGSRPATISGIEYRCFDLQGFKELVLLDQRLQLREKELLELQELNGKVGTAIDSIRGSVEKLEQSVKTMGESNAELAERASYAERRLQEELRIGFWGVAPWVALAVETIAVVVVVVTLR